MKKFCVGIIALLLVVSSVVGQTNMYIYMKDGNRIGYPVAMVDSIGFYEPLPAPIELPVVEPVIGHVVIVWHLDIEAMCDVDLVFAGNYNNYDIDPANMVHFEAIPNHAGWYKAVIKPLQKEDGTWQDDALFGRPCACALDGTFPSSWDYQWISTEEAPCKILKGSAILIEDYADGRMLCVNEDADVVYIESSHFKVDPCVPVTEGGTACVGGETFEFGYRYLMKIGDPVSTEIVEVPTTSEEICSCRVHAGTWLFTDRNIKPDEEGMLRGEGYAVLVEAPLFVITGGEHDGMWISSSIMFSSDPAMINEPYVAMTGKINNEEAYKTFFSGSMDEAAEAEYLASGALSSSSWIFFQNFDTNQSIWELGAILDGVIYANSRNPDETNYRLTVGWLDGFHGLKVDEDGNVAQPVELLPLIECEMQRLPEQSVAKKRKMPTHSHSLLHKDISVRILQNKMLHPNKDIHVINNIQ